MKNVAMLKKRLTPMVDAAETMLGEFKTKLNIVPTEALTRVHGILALTMRAEVAKPYLTAIDNWEKQEGGYVGMPEAKFLEVIYEDVLRNTAHRARFPHRSTDPISNFAEEERTSAYGEILQDWNRNF